MKDRLWIGFFCFIFSFSLYCQDIERPWRVGYNIFPLIGKSVEFFGERKINRTSSFISAAGYTFGPSFRGYIMVDDGVEIIDAEGAFFKAGGKFSTFKGKKTNAWASLIFIGSYYKEKGFGSNYPQGIKNLYAEGFTLGGALSFGVDINLIKNLGLTLGMQKGWYSRRDHLGHGAKTYQPGFGSYSMLSATQGIVGLWYAF